MRIGLAAIVLCLLPPAARAKDRTAKAEKIELTSLSVSRYAAGQEIMAYRSRALKLFPHVCARCARHFLPHRLRELTVHHKDGNHDNNPPDGSNWELLCVYCHDNEHQKQLEAAAGNVATNAKQPSTPATHSPFANLRQLMDKKGSD